MSFFRRFFGAFIIVGAVFFGTTSAFAAAAPSISRTAWRFECSTSAGNLTSNQVRCDNYYVYAYASNATSVQMTTAVTSAGTSQSGTMTAGTYYVGGQLYNYRGAVDTSGYGMSFDGVNPYSTTLVAIGSATNSSPVQIDSISLKTVILNKNNKTGATISAASNWGSDVATSSGGTPITTGGYKYRLISGTVSGTTTNAILVQYGKSDTIPFPSITSGYGFGVAANSTTPVTSFTPSTAQSTYYVISTPPSVTRSIWRPHCTGTTEASCDGYVIYAYISGSFDSAEIDGEGPLYNTSFTFNGQQYNYYSDVISWYPDKYTAQSAVITVAYGNNGNESVSHTISGIRLNKLTINRNGFTGAILESNYGQDSSTAAPGYNGKLYEYFLVPSSSSSTSAYILTRFGTGATIPFPTITSGYSYKTSSALSASEDEGVYSFTNTTGVSTTWYIVQNRVEPTFTRTAWRFTCTPPTTVGASVSTASITCSYIHVYVQGEDTTSAEIYYNASGAYGGSGTAPMVAGIYTVDGASYNWHGAIPLQPGYEPWNGGGTTWEYSVHLWNGSTIGVRGATTTPKLRLVTLNKNNHTATIASPSGYGLDVYVNGNQQGSGTDYGYKYQLVPSTVPKYSSGGEPAAAIIARYNSGDTIALPTLSASLGNGTVGWSTSASTTTHVSSMSAGTANYYLASRCNAGYYGAATASSCTECADGTFSATAGITAASSCTACPTVSSPWVAHSTSGSRNSYAGCYRTADAATADTDCAGGVIRNAAASASTWNASSFTVPTAITANVGARVVRSTFSSASQVGTGICAACSTGYGSAGGTVTSCTMCHNGTYLSNGQCMACPTGYNDSHFGATAITDCFRACHAGTYFNNGTCSTTPAGAWTGATVTYAGSTAESPNLCEQNADGPQIQTGATRTGGSIYDADDESDCGISMNINGASLWMTPTSKPSTPAFVVQIDGVKYYAPMTTSNVAMNGTTTKKFKQVYNNTTYSVTDNKYTPDANGVDTFLTNVSVNATATSTGSSGAFGATFPVASGGNSTTAVSGIGACSTGSYGDIVPLASTASVQYSSLQDGQCYCRIYYVGSEGRRSQWVRYGDIGEFRFTSGATCDNYGCPYACAQALQYYSDFRAKIFSSIPKCMSDSTCANN